MYNSFHHEQLQIQTNSSQFRHLFFVGLSKRKAWNARGMLHSFSKLYPQLVIWGVICIVMGSKLFYWLFIWERDFSREKTHGENPSTNQLLSEAVSTMDLRTLRLDQPCQVFLGDLCWATNSAACLLLRKLSSSSKKFRSQLLGILEGTVICILMLSGTAQSQFSPQLSTTGFEMGVHQSREMLDAVHGLAFLGNKSPVQCEANACAEHWVICSVLLLSPGCVWIQLVT